MSCNCCVDYEAIRETKREIERLELKLRALRRPEKPMLFFKRELPKETGEMDLNEYAVIFVPLSAQEIADRDIEKRRVVVTDSRGDNVFEAAAADTELLITCAQNEMIHCKLVDVDDAGNESIPQEWDFGSQADVTPPPQPEVPEMQFRREVSQS